MVPQAGGVAGRGVSRAPTPGAAARAVFRRRLATSATPRKAKGDPLRSRRRRLRHRPRIDDEIIDEVLLLPMLAPRSYTAEDVVEATTAHGGSVCVARPRRRPPPRRSAGLRLRLRPPAVRLARPGEFTLRAFLNGRLDLTQAEAVQALVSARTDAAADGALAALRGGLAGPVQPLAPAVSTFSPNSRRGWTSTTRWNPSTRTTSPRE